MPDGIVLNMYSVMNSQREITPVITPESTTINTLQSEEF